MSSIKFSRDENGLPVLLGEDYRLATYLQTDIQCSTDMVQTIIAALQNEDYRGEIAGNAHSLVITHRMAAIESLYDDDMPARTLPRTELLEVLQLLMTYLK